MSVSIGARCLGPGLNQREPAQSTFEEAGPVLPDLIFNGKLEKQVLL